MAARVLGSFVWLVWLGALLASGCASAGPPLPGGLVEVARNVYMVRGAPGLVEPENLGRVGNAGFIIGESSVLAIDTGTSYQHGAELLRAIGQVTDKPVKLALITHTRQEFLFGALAYRERGIPIHMQRQAAELMAARCAVCLKNLQRELGEDAMRGTAMFKPDATFEGAHTLEGGVQVLYFGHSSGPGDIAVFDPASGVLFAGGLLDQGRIPDIHDANLAGWKQALAALRGLRVRTVVPGHGPAASSAVIDSVERYLTQLEARVAALSRADRALSEVPDAAALPEFEQWDQYDTIHRRNASILFLRYEHEQLMKQGPP